MAMQAVQPKTTLNGPTLDNTIARTGSGTSDRHERLKPSPRDGRGRPATLTDGTAPLLGEGSWGGDLLPPLTIERAEQGGEVLLLQPDEFERDNRTVLMRVLDPALVVELDDFLQRLEAPIVHIGSGAGNLPQRGRLERPDVVGILRDHIAAQIDRVGGPADTEIVEPLVGKIKSRMAPGAAGFAPKQFKPPLPRLRQGFLIAPHIELIDRTIAGQDRPVKTRDSPAHILDAISRLKTSWCPDCASPCYPAVR